MWGTIVLGATFLTLFYSIKALIYYCWWKDAPKRRWIPDAFIIIAVGLFFYCYNVLAIGFKEVSTNNPDLLDFSIATILTILFVTVVIALFHLVEDIIFVARWLIKKFKTKKSDGKQSTSFATLSRSAFLTKLGFGVGGFVLGSFIWGMTRGKFGFRVMREQVAFDNLPDAFVGKTIVQISDLHLGSFKDHFDPLIEAVEIINDLNPDYIVFTGDLINSYDTEADNWVSIFSKLKAKEGKFSILGNHDYGYFRNWDDDPEMEKRIREGVIAKNREMGFDILLNENRKLTIGDDSISIIGVENWGEAKWSPRAGDLKKAMEGVNKDDFKLLLSHDPTHWENEVMEKTDIDLTLSGHTHGAQLGFRIPGVVEISPASFMFKRWGGLYTEGKQNLYINRGMGYLIMPGRVGMKPEITLLELTKA